MSSLDADFETLISSIKAGREYVNPGNEPIYYLVFDPSEILPVKRKTSAWIARLGNEGWNVHTFSIAKEIDDLLRSNPFWPIWESEDRKNPLDWKNANQSLATEIESEDGLPKKLETVLESVEMEPNGLLLVTDLEGLHPYLRIGTIEAKLVGRFSRPTIFLYPGTRTGKTRLRFLGFYPEDGNYRSVHIGG